MKFRKKLAFVCCWLFLITAGFSALQTPIDFNFSFNGSNAVQVAWNAYPGKSYVLQTATNLAGTSTSVWHAAAETRDRECA